LRQSKRGDVAKILGTLEIVRYTERTAEKGAQLIRSGNRTQEDVAMATAKLPRTRTLPPLENGDRLDQRTFHARYEAMPEDCRAELIGGMVHMPSPQKAPHGKAQQLVVRWLDEYAEATPGTEAILNSTQILGPDSEPEPDACLFIVPESGGQVYLDEDEYLNGAPELIVEVSSATESIDLHRKKLDYQKAGVREYVVLALRMQQVFWFVRQRGKYKEVPLPTDGVFHSRAFPGLWLEAEAVLRNQRPRVLAVLRQGLASPEHAAFVARLAKQTKK
jgi:Uma2 family endonuclease